MTQRPAKLDLEMVANDIAEVLSEYHGIDVDSNDVLTALSPFIEAMQARAAAHDEVEQVEQAARANAIAAGLNWSDLVDAPGAGKAIWRERARAKLRAN